MGIQGLMKVITEHAPAAIKESEIKHYFGRKVAIDASMSIYQFLVAVRGQDGQQLANESGDVTSHLMGIFYRTVRMVENGIKPLYVFDGKPPEMKSDEASLKKRGEKRSEAESKLLEAQEEGNSENVEKFGKRTVKATKEHSAECQRLLKLMGFPFIIAPCEAEAQCAVLSKAGIVYGAGSEDMDTLCFGTPVLLRRLTFSEARNLPILEINLERTLEGLGLNMDQFVDMCILLGCDYCDSIKGIGPHRAYNLIKEHGSIEAILPHLNKDKHPIPENWPFKQARDLMKTPDVTDPKTMDIKWEDPDEEGIVDFLVKEKHFSEERVRATVKKLIKCRGKATQGRLDSFFKPIPKDPSKPASAGAKRKVESKTAKKPLAKKGKK